MGTAIVLTIDSAGEPDQPDLRASGDERREGQRPRIAAALRTDVVRLTLRSVTLLGRLHIHLLPRWFDRVFTADVLEHIERFVNSDCSSRTAS
jgi:hypothetical protein